MNEEAGSSGPTPSAAGTSMPTPAMSQFVISPLQPGERIDDWQPLFTAAVTTLLAKPAGEKIGLRAIARVCEEKARRSGINQRSDRIGKLRGYV